VDLDEILYGCDCIEYSLLEAYVGKVGILFLPITSCCTFKIYCYVSERILYERCHFEWCEISGTEGYEYEHESILGYCAV
jgi:hypothetical protein